MKVHLGKAVTAGIAGTAAMTLLMLLAPMMGMPRMNIGAMLGSVMGGIAALGWMAHFVISGSMLAAAGSLMGHLVYGAVVGSVYGHYASRDAAACPACP